MSLAPMSMELLCEYIQLIVHLLQMNDNSNIHTFFIILF